MHAVIQWDILRNHLLKLTHNSQDSITGRFSVLLIPRDGDLVLGLKRRMLSEKRVASSGTFQEQQCADLAGWSKETKEYNCVDDG